WRHDAGGERADAGRRLRRRAGRDDEDVASTTPDDAPVGADEADAGPDVDGGRIDVAVQGDGASLVLAAVTIPVVGEGSKAAGGREIHPHRNAGREDARPESAEMGRVGDDRAGRRGGEEVAGDVEDEVDAGAG